MTPVFPLASHTMPDFLSPVLTGMVVVAGAGMLLVAAVGVRLFVRGFSARQLMGILTAVLTTIALAVAATIIAVVFAIETGERGFYLSAGIGLCMCWYVGYRVARYYAPPAPAPEMAMPPAAQTAATQDNPYSAPAAATQGHRPHPPLRNVFHLPVEPTWYHRVFQAEPGSLPKWVCNTATGGVCLISIAPVVSVAIGMAISTLALFYIDAAAYVLVAGTLWVAIRLGREGGRTRHLERRCRARLRRHECLRCGDKLSAELPDARYCSVCSA